MQVLIRGDDRRRHLRPREQLAIVGGAEIGARLVGDELEPVALEIGDTDPVDLRVARGHLAAEEADATGADDGKPDALR